MKLIDKSALVAEIERRIKEHHSGYLVCLKDIFSFLDTLEVKEVDLKKEIREYLSTYWPEEKELHPFLGHIAKHFFELGLKAQKGK